VAITGQRRRYRKGGKEKGNKTIQLLDARTCGHHRAGPDRWFVRSAARTMNAQLSMDIGDLHGMSHESVGHGELLSGHSPHARPSPRGLGHRAMGMATLLDGGDYHPGHHGHLHPAIGMCEAPPGMSASSTYTTLTPLQSLPPISTVSDKFPPHHHPHHHAHHPHHHPHQRIPGNVSGSFTLMREDRSLAPMNSLYPAYHHKDPCMGQSLSPLSGSGLAGIHTSQAGIPPYAHPGAAMPGEKMLTPSGFEAHHPAMLGRHTEQQQHMSSSAGMVQINGLHHHHHHHHPHAHVGAQGHGQGLQENSREQASGPGQQGGGDGGGGGGGGGVSGGQMEEVNTKEVAQRITTELKRYSIPQAIFAQRVLCRSQGTLSDLLRNPKPWSKLKSGRETFRRMWKWLQEPEFQRMSSLRLAGERSLGKAPLFLFLIFSMCVCVCVGGGGGTEEPRSSRAVHGGWGLKKDAVDFFFDNKEREK